MNNATTGKAIRGGPTTNKICAACDCPISDPWIPIGDKTFHATDAQCIKALKTRAETAEAEVAALRAQQAAQWQQTNGTPPAGDFEVKFRATAHGHYLLRNFTTENEEIRWGDPGVMWIRPQEAAQ